MLTIARHAVQALVDHILRFEDTAAQPVVKVAGRPSAISSAKLLSWHSRTPFLGAIVGRTGLVVICVVLDDTLRSYVRFNPVFRVTTLQFGEDEAVCRWWL